MCVPRFDSPPLFRGLLGHHRGGQFAITVDGLRSTHQRYLPGTGIVCTELLAADGGRIELTGLFALREQAGLAEYARAGRGELLRRVRATRNP